MRRTYKYRLYPNKEQAEKLTRVLNVCCRLYNNALAERHAYYQENQKTLSAFTQMLSLPQKKRGNPEVAGVYSQVLQDVLLRLDKAFALFFVRVKAKNGKAGYPRFKSADRYDSFTYPQVGGFRLTQHTLKLSKIGNIRIKLHRPLEGTPKTCTVKREIDRWYACISCDKVEPTRRSAPQGAVGIDLGIEHFAFLSNGGVVENPKCLIQSEGKLRKAQKVLSRRKVGSRNRKRQRIKVARIHRKITYQRADFLHKLSHKIAGNFNFIAIEDLRISNMIKNRYLAKSIADASWGQFTKYLRYKAEEAGGEVVSVDPKGTSQVCSRCGGTVKKSLSVRVHNCHVCGLVIPRDHNSAIEILQRAIGREPPESTPSEIATRQSLN